MPCPGSPRFLMCHALNIGTHSLRGTAFYVYQRDDLLIASCFELGSYVAVWRCVRFMICSRNGTIHVTCSARSRHVLRRTSTEVSLVSFLLLWLGVLPCVSTHLFQLFLQWGRYGLCMSKKRFQLSITLILVEHSDAGHWHHSLRHFHWGIIECS